MNSGEDFYLQVAYALTGCQLVEQRLKLYISEALELARKCVGRRMTFKLSGEDYEDASLERLFEGFRKFTNNDALVTELRKFKAERNYLSHKGIAHCLDLMGDLDESAAADFKIRLHAIQAEAQRLERAIHDEAAKYLGHLYFGEFPE